MLATRPAGNPEMSTERTGVQAAGVFRVPGVRGGAADERDLLEQQRDGGDHHHGADPDRAQGEMTSLGKRFHLGVHRPVLCPATFT